MTSRSELPPSRGGARVRFWDRNFELIYDSAVTDASLADVGRQIERMTIDDNGTRRLFAVDEVPPFPPFEKVTIPELPT